MDPTSSNPTPPHDPNHERRSNPRFQPTQAFSDRVLRALRHRLLLLHRTDPNFYVLGATGNVYIVNISTTLTCTCPDRATPCKHILFVLIKVLGVSFDDTCLRRQTLRECQLTRLLSNTTCPESLAGPSLCERFHQVFFLEQREAVGPPGTRIEVGSTCPICLEEVGKDGERVVVCHTCRNPLHEECLMTWKRVQRRRGVSCVVCRSRWRNRVDGDDKYLNLGAYVGENDHIVQDNNHDSDTCYSMG